MHISVLINLRKSPICLFLLLGVFLFFSCDNIQEKDKPNQLHIVSISTFDDKSENYKIGGEFMRLEWGQMLKDSLPEYAKNHKRAPGGYSTKSPGDTIVDFFIYCDSGKDDCVAVQQLLQEAFRDFEKLYLANKTFITEATELAYRHVAILDEGKVDEFLELLPPDINAEDRKIIESQRKGRNMRHWKRFLVGRIMGRINSVDSNLVNWITIPLLLNKRRSPDYANDEPNVFSQNFTYKSVDGEIVLSRYTMGSSTVDIDHLPDLIVHPYAKTSAYDRRLKVARTEERKREKEEKVRLRNKFAPKYEDYLSQAMKYLEQNKPETIKPFMIKSELEKDGKLNGKVKSIRKKHYKALLEDGKIVKGDFDCSSCNDYFDKYNEFGNKIEHITDNRGEVIYHYGYKFLEYERQSFNYPDEDEVVGKDVYDKFGNQIVSYSYADSTIKKTIFQKFDKEKNEIEKVVFDKNQEYSTGWSDPPKTEYDYDENGIILERRRFAEILNHKERLIYLAEKTIYEYDEQNNEKIFTTEYDRVCNITRKDTYDQANGTREFFELIDNQFVLVKRYIFEYDKKRNWTKAISYKKDRSKKNSLLEPGTIVERKITYYQ